MGILDDLQEVSTQASTARVTADEFETQRDELIRAARTHGHNVNEIAGAAKISAPRVYQVLRGTP